MCSKVKLTVGVTNTVPKWDLYIIDIFVHKNSM